MVEIITVVLVGAIAAGIMVSVYQMLKFNKESKAFSREHFKDMREIMELRRKLLEE